LNSLNSAILPFAKMQALGNDFIVIDGERLIEAASTGHLLKNWQAALPGLARQLCSRRFGIGADGLILVMNLQQAELLQLAHDIYGSDTLGCQWAWTYTNSDGFSAEICGNGLRCLTLWAHKRGLLLERSRILTAVGPVEVVFTSEDQISVDLGEPSLCAKDIPFAASEAEKPVVQESFAVGGVPLSITCVNMGNPHCIIFAGAPLNGAKIELPFASEEKLKELPLALTALAEQIQADSHFPEGVNVSMVLSFDQHCARAVVFERGCGPTLACGSAAAAILVGGVLENKLKRQAEIILPGGGLIVTWSTKDNRVRISGPARFSFEGQVIIDLDSLNCPLPKASLGSSLR
jgi:diaminopimelate epimerase